MSVSPSEHLSLLLSESPTFRSSTLFAFLRVLGLMFVSVFRSDIASGVLPAARYSPNNNNNNNCPWEMTTVLFVGRRSGKH